MEKHADPTFELHKMMAQFWGKLTLKIADATVIVWTVEPRSNASITHFCLHLTPPPPPSHPTHDSCCPSTTRTKRWRSGPTSRIWRRCWGRRTVRCTCNPCTPPSRSTPTPRRPSRRSTRRRYCSFINRPHGGERRPSSALRHSTTAWPLPSAGCSAHPASPAGCGSSMWARRPVCTWATGPSRFRGSRRRSMTGG